MARESQLTIEEGQTIITLENLEFSFREITNAVKMPNELSLIYHQKTL